MSGFDDLKRLMDRLREPGGCPWDREQTLPDLRATVLEEAYEVVEAIEHGAHDNLREELGDLLLQVLFIARIESEAGRFDVEGVIREIHDKLVRRHPHVFGEAEAGTSEEVLRQWERIKNEERRERRLLDGVPRALPALLRAARLSSKAALAGFDWEREADLAAKLREELQEFLAEEHLGDRPAMEREMGDLLFVVANLARRWGIDPEAALQGANDRFIRRFGHVEDSLRRASRRLQEATLE
jgi:nucleoside triphosphate diphosphatase